MGVVIEYRSRDGHEHGVVDHINHECGFGYVRSPRGRHIFVFGRAIRHDDAGALVVGSRVRFRVGGHGRVDALEPMT